MVRMYFRFIVHRSTIFSGNDSIKSIKFAMIM